MRFLKLWTLILAVCAIIIGFFGIVFLLHDFALFLYPSAHSPTINVFLPSDSVVYLMFAGFIVTAVAGWLMLMTLMLEREKRT